MTAVGPLDWDRAVVRLEYAARAVIEEKEKPRRLVLEELEGAVRTVERIREFRVPFEFDQHKVPPASPVVRESFLTRFSPADADRLRKAGDVILMAADASPAPPSTEPIGSRRLRAAGLEIHAAGRGLWDVSSICNWHAGLTDLEFDLALRATEWSNRATILALDILEAVHVEPQEAEGPPRERPKSQ